MKMNVFTISVIDLEFLYGRNLSLHAAFILWMKKILLQMFIKRWLNNVRRLRHRTCLALWCGNNEMEWGWVDWGWKAPEYHDLKAAYDRFFHHILPTWCEAEDPDHAYWASSPYSGTPFEDPNGQQQGDAHYWDVWHGRKTFQCISQSISTVYERVWFSITAAHVYHSFICR